VQGDVGGAGLRAAAELLGDLDAAGGLVVVAANQMRQPRLGWAAFFSVAVSVEPRRVRLKDLEESRPPVCRCAAADAMQRRWSSWVSMNSVLTAQTATV
jgi:hypothetical protein